MPGFYISDLEHVCAPQNAYPERCCQEELATSWSGTVRRNTLKKFMQDKTLTETGDYVLVQEGYLLNKAQLQEKYHAAGLPDLMTAMYEKNGETFFNEYRGGASGALYDKKKKTWLVWTNHTGDAFVFYYRGDGGFCIGSQLNYVTDTLKANHIKMHFDEQAAYQMLTFSFMVDDSTCIGEVKRLQAGHYLKISDKGLAVHCYHRFAPAFEKYDACTDDELVEKIDAAFVNAIKLEYEKDLEYGYHHLTDLSGGLDSRMNVWVAHTLGYTPIQTMGYGKANYRDELIAKKIAEELREPYLFKPLDDAGFLYEIDEMTQLLNGASDYCGVTGGKQMLEALNMERYGLEHTGMIGDVVLGSYLTAPDDEKNKRPTGRESERLADRLEKEYDRDYASYELYLLHARGMQGMANTYALRRNYTEAVSPFMDVDFFQLCMDIRPQRRIQHNLYKKWILTKYPGAAKFQWETSKLPIAPPTAKEKLEHFAWRVKRKLWFMTGRQEEFMHNNNMNPISWWIEHDIKLRSFLDNTFSERQKIMEDQKEASDRLCRDMAELYRTGNDAEKTMVLTVQSAYMLYFDRGQ